MNVEDDLGMKSGRYAYVFIVIESRNKKRCGKVEADGEPAKGDSKIKVNLYT